MQIKLISHTPNPEKLVAASAKLCYSSSSPEDLLEKLSEEETSSFIARLMKLGHESPLEHITFTFAIEGVSRSLLAQITRHRIASYSVQSQRYVRSKEIKYVIPHSIENIPEAKEEFCKAMEGLFASYNKLTEILQKKYMEQSNENVSDIKNQNKMIEKSSIEDARYVLPNAWETNLICTFNARSLLNFFDHRCCSRAQWEIRELACKMLKAVKEVAPNIFTNAGPGCLKGVCPEGKMSCGESLKVREFFKSL